MPAVMIKMDLQRLHEILQTASGRNHFVSRYPDLMDWYDEHIIKGFQDTLVQASLAALWQQESEQNAQSICRRISSGAT